MPLTILDLIPQSPQSLIVNRTQKLSALHFTKLIIQFTKMVFEEFYFNKSMGELDPHVGETLCQIRAYKIYLMSLQEIDWKYIICEFNKIIEFEIRCSNVICNFELLMNECDGKYNKILDQSESMENFLKDNLLVLEFTEDVCFLVQSLILTKFSLKDFFGISLAIDYELLGNTLNRGKTFARNFTRLLQKQLSQMSCNFIKLLLNDLPELYNLGLVLPTLQQQDNHQRSIYPCYETTKILLNHILYTNCPILLIANQQSLTEQNSVPILYLPSENQYMLDIPSSLGNKPYITIKGVVKYDDPIITENSAKLVERIAKIGIANILLLNMAQHPQFSAEELKEISDNPYRKISTDSKNKLNDYVNELEKEFLSMKVQANAFGCSQTNQSLFFIKHILTDSLDNQVRKKVLLPIL